MHCLTSPDSIFILFLRCGPFSLTSTSIVGEMGVYWVEKHIQEGKQVHWGRKKSFGWMFFKAMLKHWHGQRSPVEYVKAKKLMQKDVYLQWLSKYNGGHKKIH